MNSEKSMTELNGVLVRSGYTSCTVRNYAALYAINRALEIIGQP